MLCFVFSVTRLTKRILKLEQKKNRLKLRGWMGAAVAPEKTPPGCLRFSQSWSQGWAGICRNC